MLLSLVAHTVGYKMIVGAHNPVDVRRMWEILSCSPCRANDGAYNTVDVICMLEVALSFSGMVDVGACHIVDAQRYVGDFTMFARYGKYQRP